MSDIDDDDFCPPPPPPPPEEEVVQEEQEEAPPAPPSPVGSAAVAPADDSSSDDEEEVGEHEPPPPPPAALNVSQEDEQEAPLTRMLHSSLSNLSPAALNARTAALNPRPESSSQAAARTLLHQGWLDKKSPGALFKVYQKRYFVLFSDKLEYWKAKEDAQRSIQSAMPVAGLEPQGLVPLYSVREVQSLADDKAKGKGKPCRFNVLVGDQNVQRSFELQTASAFDCEEWVRVLRAAVEKHQSSQIAVTPHSSGRVSGSSSTKAGGVAKKFWKSTQQIEEMLTTLPPAQKAAATPTAEEAPAAASTPTSSKAPASAPNSAFTPVAASGPASSPSSNPSVAPAAAAATTGAPLSSLPQPLRLLRAMTKTVLGTVYLATTAAAASDAAADVPAGSEQYVLLHVVRKDGGADEPRARALFEGMSRLQSPYLARQLHWGCARDALWAAYAPAFRVHDSLLHCLAAHRRFPEPVVRGLGAQLACLLDRLHSSQPQPCTARNLSPDNLYFAADGRIVLLDFFLASPSPSGEAALDDNAQLVPEYLTPEMVAEGRERPAADWWRLGVLLYELSVGIPPFRGGGEAQTRAEKAQAIAAKIAEHEPSSLRFPPFIAPTLQALVRALLTPDEGQRLSGAALRAHPFFAEVDWERVETGAGAPDGSEADDWLRSKVLCAPDEATVRAANPAAKNEQLAQLLGPPPAHRASPTSPAPRIELSDSFADAFGSCEGAEDYATPSQAASRAAAPSKSATAGAAASSAQVAPAGGEGGGDFEPLDLGRCTPPPTAPMPSELVELSDDSSDEDDEEDEETAAAAAASSPSRQTGRQSGAVGVLRGLVSKKKLRFQQDGYDLDLSYITPRIIAMGFPSEGASSVYRNPLPEVQRFFRARHAGRFRVYNLCSERRYEAAKFEGRVCEIPFNDHSAPDFGLMYAFCVDAHRFLKEHKDNVIAVHCKAGKGRTGTMIAALLVFLNYCKSAEDALQLFGQKRTKNLKGVTIPSQRRYVSYFSSHLSAHRLACGSLAASLPARPAPVSLRLMHIRLHTVPDFDVGGGCDPYFLVKGAGPAEPVLYDYRAALKAHGMKVQGCHDKAQQRVELPVPGTGGAAPAPGSPCDVRVGCLVSGDVKFAFFDEDTLKGDDAMFHCWLHTSFIDPKARHVLLTKEQCDKAVKDKKGNHFKKEFKVEFFFAEPETTEVPPPQ